VSSDPQYTVSPSSAYACPQPGYYPVTGSCSQFWVCREVLPGTLSAVRPFRCPARYLFDPATQLCQREWKVACRARTSLIYSHLPAISLREQQLAGFFRQDLTFREDLGPYSSHSHASSLHPPLPHYSRPYRYQTSLPPWALYPYGG